jgi:plastocyanin
VPRLAPKLTILAALILLAIPACSSKSGPTAGTSSSAPATATTSPTGTSSPMATPSSTATTSGAPSAAPVAGTQITISKFLYSPVNLQVKPGATITVTNQDPVAHTVTAESGSSGIAFDSKTINANASGTFTAPTTPGTYPYICTFHPQMHGILTVTA